jgi:acyl carrier protein
VGSDLRYRIASIVAEAIDGALEPEGVLSVGGDLADLGVDSMAQMRIVVAIEDQFDVDFDFAAAARLFSDFDRLTAYVRDAQSTGGRS